MIVIKYKYFYKTVYEMIHEKMDRNHKQTKLNLIQHYLDTGLFYILVIINY